MKITLFLSTAAAASLALGAAGFAQSDHMSSGAMSSSTISSGAMASHDPMSSGGGGDAMSSGSMSSVHGAKATGAMAAGHPITAGHKRRRHHHMADGSAMAPSSMSH